MTERNNPTRASDAMKRAAVLIHTNAQVLVDGFQETLSPLCLETIAGMPANQCSLELVVPCDALSAPRVVLRLIAPNGLAEEVRSLFVNAL